MAETTRTPLRNLIALGKVDHSTARILSEKKQYADKLARKSTELRQAQSALSAKMKTYKDRKTRYDREERAIRDEKEKLVARRKALASLNNYKVQQAAEKEIEHANRQLATREEALLETLQDLETCLSENTALEESIKELSASKDAIETEIKEAFPVLEAREKELKSEREHIVADVLPAYLHNYERIRGQYFADPIVAVHPETKSCSGCHMQIRPQILLELHKGEKIINCAGCGRILYLEETSS